jgi:hypothetical protein
VLHWGTIMVDTYAAGKEERVKSHKGQVKSRIGGNESHQTHETESIDCADFTDSEWGNLRTSAKSAVDLLGLHFSNRFQTLAETCSPGTGFTLPERNSASRR